MPAELVIEGELEAVLAKPIGRYEAEDRPGELATRIVATTFSFNAGFSFWGTIVNVKGSGSRTNNRSV